MSNELLTISIYICVCVTVTITLKENKSQIGMKVHTQMAKNLNITNNKN